LNGSQTVLNLLIFITLFLPIQIQSTHDKEQCNANWCSSYMT